MKIMQLKRLNRENHEMQKNKLQNSNVILKRLGNAPAFIKTGGGRTAAPHKTLRLE